MKDILSLFAAIFTPGAAGARVFIVSQAGFTLATQRSEKMRSANDQATKTIKGFAAGIGFHVPVGKHKPFFIQPERMYMQQRYLSAQ